MTKNLIPGSWIQTIYSASEVFIWHLGKQGIALDVFWQYMMMKRHMQYEDHTCKKNHLGNLPTIWCLLFSHSEFTKLGGVGENCILHPNFDHMTSICFWLKVYNKRNQKGQGNNFKRVIKNRMSHYFYNFGRSRFVYLDCYL